VCWLRVWGFIGHGVIAFLLVLGVLKIPSERGQGCLVESGRPRGVRGCLSRREGVFLVCSVVTVHGVFSLWAVSGVSQGRFEAMLNCVFPVGGVGWSGSLGSEPSV